LKDQLDENRHNTEKLKKAENAIEKYKKKMEEGADLRRMFKVNNLFGFIFINFDLTVIMLICYLLFCRH